MLQRSYALAYWPEKSRERSARVLVVPLALLSPFSASSSQLGLPPPPSRSSPSSSQLGLPPPPPSSSQPQAAALRRHYISSVAPDGKSFGHSSCRPYDPASSLELFNLQQDDRKPPSSRTIRRCIGQCGYRLRRRRSMGCRFSRPWLRGGG